MSDDTKLSLAEEHLFFLYSGRLLCCFVGQQEKKGLAGIEEKCMEKQGIGCSSIQRSDKEFEEKEQKQA